MNKNMMTYGDFKNLVMETFKNYLSDPFKRLELSIVRVNKYNCALDGLNFISPDEESNVSPTIYIKDMYDRYLQCGDYQYVFESVAKDVEKAFLTTPNIADIHAGLTSENVIFSLVNTANNDELLSTVPHRNFLDLSIIYRFVIALDETSSGIGSAVITNSLAERLGYDEETLYNLAIENTKRFFPTEVRTMYDVVCEMTGKDGEDLGVPNGFEPPEMYIVSNSERLYGSATMLYEDVFYELAQKLNNNFYILPSSVHELIVLPYREDDCVATLAQMVFEINMTQVDVCERLSNQVYFYDRESRIISIISDCSNASLADTESDEAFTVLC